MLLQAFRQPRKPFFHVLVFRCQSVERSKGGASEKHDGEPTVPFAIQLVGDSGQAHSNDQNQYVHKAVGGTAAAPKGDAQ